AAFFAAQQDVAFEHPVADIFEADRRLPDFAAEELRNLVYHFRGGKRLRHVAAQPARPREMPQQDGKNLVRCDERSIRVHRADAIRIAIERESRAIAPAAHGAPQRLHMGFDWLRVHAAEERIARAADLVALDAVAAE